MTVSIFHTFLLGILLSFLGACQETPAANQTNPKLIITGSSTIAPLIAEIGKRFEIHHLGTRVDVQTGGSSRGIADIRQGLADIGMVSRSLLGQEQDLYNTVIARDRIGMIVHQSNPVTSLTDSEIIGIYTGATTNWKEIGGPDAPITVVTKAQGRATLDLFLDYFNLTNSQVKAQVVIGDNEQGIKIVAGNPYAIAYVSIGTAEYDATQGVTIKLVSLNSILTSLVMPQVNQLPLSRPLNLVTTSIPTGLAKMFIEFAQSSDVHDLVTRHHFVPFTS